MLNSKSSGAALQAALMMLGATMLLASMHGLVRLLSSDLHPFVIVFFRNLFGFIAITPLLARYGLKTLKTSNKKLHTFRAVVGIIAMMAFFYGLSKVPIANATALSFSTTLFASLAAVIFLKEKIRVRRWLAIIVGFVGVIVVLNPSLQDFNAYSLLLVWAAITWGISVTIVKKLTQTESSTTIVSIMTLSLLVLSSPTALIYWRTPSFTELTLLLGVGAFASMGHLLMTEAIKRSEVAVVMSIDFARLIWTVLIGVWFFSERVDVQTIIGAVIIFSAGWYIIFRESKVSANSEALLTAVERKHD